MATFHARPHESDRRSGASKMIKRSHASNHIFDGNGSVGELSDASEDVNEKEDKKPHGNPFEALGLHLRLANAVSSERGPFGYKRPTTIQTNAALALLGSPRMKKSRSTQERQANLFVQSETGSGKTLAYLLPIVQVSIFLGAIQYHCCSRIVSVTALWLRTELATSVCKC